MLKKAGLLTFFLLLAAQQTIAAPKFPFPQDQSYEYGTKPSAVNHNDVQAAYEVFVQGYYEESGDKARIKWDTPAQTVSEGIGYGMLIFVFMDNAKNNTQGKFDKLWNYYNANKNGRGLMNWKITGFGGVVGANGATDGDIDAAFALCLAYYQWGDGKYKTAATSLTNSIFSSEVSGSVLKPGDDPNFTRPLNPSYFITAGLNFFDKHQTDFGSHGWSAVTSWCYQTLGKAANGSTGLVPDWCDDGGGANSRGPDYKFDAARTPWRMGWAYCWFGDDGAKSVATKMTAWIKQKTGNTPAQIVDGYKIDGTELGKSNIPTYLGPFACGAMVDASNQAWIDACYSRLASFTGDDNYYNQTIKVLSLLLLTGNCLDLSKATPKTDFSINTNVVPSNAGAITVTPAGPYKTGASVTITVTPNDKNQFTSWGGDLSGTSTTQTVTVTSDMVVTAYFNAGNRDLLDDCEDGDNLTNLGTRWFCYNDSTSKGASIVTPKSNTAFTMTEGGANGSKMAAKIAYTLKKGSNTNNPFVGMGFSLTNKADSGLDMSKATSLTFFYKGDSGDVRIETANITDAAFYFTTVPKCADWKQISVKFDAMKQPSWSKNAKPFDRTKATKIAWQTPSSAKDNQTGEIWVDDIHLPGYVMPVGIKPAVPSRTVKNSFSITRSADGALSARYALSSPEAVYIDVFNVSGKIIRHLSIGIMNPGRHCETIRLPEAAMAEGAYVVRLVTSTNSYCDKIALTR
jgi:endoglucanase